MIVRTRTLVAAAAALTLVAIPVSGCGGDSSASSTAPAAGEFTAGEFDLKALKEQQAAERKLKKKTEERAKKAKDKEEEAPGVPSARFSFMPREDALLLEAAARLGKQWRKIAEILPGRTENSV
jgi:hypothetical protein